MLQEVFCVSKPKAHIQKDTLEKPKITRIIGIWNTQSVFTTRKRTGNEGKCKLLLHTVIIIVIKDKTNSQSEEAVMYFHCNGFVIPVTKDVFKSVTQ